MTWINTTTTNNNKYTDFPGSATKSKILTSHAEDVDDQAL